MDLSFIARMPAEEFVGQLGLGSSLRTQLTEMLDGVAVQEAFAIDVWLDKSTDSMYVLCLDLVQRSVRGTWQVSRQNPECVMSFHGELQDAFRSLILL